MACENSGACSRITFIASVLVALVYVLNAGTILANRSLQDSVIKKQAELNEKNAKITQNNAFANINQSLINALAAAAITKKDEQIKALLIQNNINLPGKGDAAKPAAPPQ